CHSYHPAVLSFPTRRSSDLLWSSIVASAFYAVMRFLSEDVLWDTITALGMMVCFYYGITALASTWYFRKSAPREGARAVFSKVILPGLGGVLLLVVFGQTTYDSMNPSFGSGSNIAGIGLVGIIGIVVLGLGVVLMLVQSRFSPDFFRGRILGRTDATNDTSAMDVFDDGLDG